MFFPRVRKMIRSIKSHSSASVSRLLYVLAASPRQLPRSLSTTKFVESVNESFTLRKVLR